MVSLAREMAAMDPSLDRKADQEVQKDGPKLLTGPHRNLRRNGMVMDTTEF